MHLFPGLKPPFRWMILISFGVFALFSAAKGFAQADSPIMEPISEAEFERIFGSHGEGPLLASEVGPEAAAAAWKRRKLSAPFQDKSIDVLPEIRPRAPLKQRDVLPKAFSTRALPALPTPTLVLAGYDNQPDLSERGCAVREHDQHNLAYRCNAPIALNIPGGDAPSARFVKEMEAETGFEAGYDFWPGDKDAVTGDRLLTSRDIVTGMRFTMRYLNARGFTIAKAPCSSRKTWRWSYVCMHDDKWAALSMRERCEFVLDGLLTVEGGKTQKWFFAPLPSPDTVKGALISYGLTTNPGDLQDAASLCTEVEAQERVEAMTKKLLQQAPKKLGLKLTSLANTDGANLTLGAQIKGREIIVARLTSKTPDALSSQLETLSEIWRGLGGSQVCQESDCARVITVALPPLPDYRPEDHPKHSDSDL